MAMKVIRKRTYLLDPRYRKEKIFRFAATQVIGWHKSQRTGKSHPHLRHGYGRTVVSARLDLVKKPFRREEKRPKSARELADRRRYLHYLHNDHPQFNRKTTARTRAAIERWMECEHDWQPTHPKATSFAERCQKCNSRRGEKSLP